ncbi:Hypothetical protein AA314_07112 [Archangium gephyra]|uniref:Uncharacterized protein n=1 Tax=Archangium gephyra TaxID=48 RepID=A0AAC8QDH1_9BACT|nr:Hypothetical protein AA314_07112 [Archangium gephyra]
MVYETRRLGYGNLSPFPRRRRWTGRPLGRRLPARQKTPSVRRSSQRPRLPSRPVWLRPPHPHHAWSRPAGPFPR